MTDTLQSLIDKQEIRDCMARYARGVDRADWEAVRDTYHDDAYDDHGDYKGAVLWHLKAAELGHAQAQSNLGVCYE